MEIDFLGLNSSKYTVEQQDSKNVFADAGEVEISLSLSTATSSHKEILNFSENNKKKETWEFLACDKMNIPNSCHENSAKKEQLLLLATPVFHRPSAAGFPYDLNAAARANSTSPMLYPQRPTLFNQPQKADHTNMYMAGNASTRLPTSGYTPTVAMARKATLARFLEKRSHRMNQGRISPLMGKPVSVPICEGWESISNKKRNNNLKTR